MIRGIGNDIIEIARIQKSIESHGSRFLKKLFTEKEQAYCQGTPDFQATRFAGRFAAKEAIAKALGTGFGESLSWLDIEITNDSAGKPLARLSESAAKRFGQPSLMVSISHCHEYATAVAMQASPD